VERKTWSYELPPAGASDVGVEQYQVAGPGAESWKATALLERRDELYVAAAPSGFALRRHLVATSWSAVERVDHDELTIHVRGLEGAVALDPSRAVENEAADTRRVTELPPAVSSPRALRLPLVWTCGATARVARCPPGRGPRGVSARTGAGSRVLSTRRRRIERMPTTETQHTVKDVMTPNPRTVTPETSVVEAAKLMTSEDVGPLPVVEGGELVGIVTDRDLVVRVIAEGRDPESTLVGDVCSSKPVTVSPDDDVSHALTLLAQHQVRRLPVAEGDQIVGIVAQADIAREESHAAVGEVVEDISR
jgi:CBS domain-containing protein